MHWLISSDGSWAFQRVESDGERVIREGGPQRLWTELEGAHARWHDWGRPEWDRFGLTITPDRRELWLDDPVNVIPSR